MDVKALYANMPNNEGIAAVKRKHYNCIKKIVATKVITFLALILPLDNFIFNSKFYRQMKSSATMGIICAPTQVNLCPSSKRDTSILSLKTNPVAVYVSLAIFLWHRQNQITNLNSS